ncbi:MAG TPA: hypothetical protein VNK82_12720 [Terriglobales bacterium]|nr:hypothetical protein [Terriglobales bacterium]
MRPVTLIGIVLIVMGAAGLMIGEFTYKTERNSVSVGPVQATVKEEKKISIPPILSGLTMAVGAALVVAGRKKSQT